MDIFLQKVNPDLKTLRQYIIQKAAREISQISEPCYYPKTKHVYFQLLNIYRISDQDVKDFVKRTYKGTKAERWPLWTDPGTTLLLFTVYYLAKNKETRGAEAALLYYMIFQYARLMNKQIRYCDPGAFKYALETLNKTHLFYREGTIGNAILFLTQEVKKKYFQGIKKWDMDVIIAFIGMSRTRLSQSIKSFAEKYYQAKKEGRTIGDLPEYDEIEADSRKIEVIEKTGIHDVVVKNITVYRETDHVSLMKAREKTGLNTSLTALLADVIKQPELSERLTLILKAFMKEIKGKNDLCGEKYHNNISYLMRVKQLKPGMFKYEIQQLWESVKKDPRFSGVRTYQYNKIYLFYAYYLTSAVRHKVCGTKVP